LEASEACFWVRALPRHFHRALSFHTTPHHITPCLLTVFAHRYQLIDLIVFINYTSYCETKGKKAAVQRTPGATPTSGVLATPAMYDGKAKNLDDETWDSDYICPGLFTWLVHGPLSSDPCGFVDPTEIKEGKSAQSQKEVDAAAAKLRESKNQTVDAAQGNTVPVGGTMHDMAKMGIAVTHLQSKNRATSVLGMQGMNATLTAQMTSILGALGNCGDNTHLQTILQERLTTIFGTLDRVQATLQEELQVTTALPETTRAFIAVGDRNATAPTVAASSEVALLSAPAKNPPTSTFSNTFDYSDHPGMGDDDGANVHDLFADENNEPYREATESGAEDLGGDDTDSAASDVDKEDTDSAANDVDKEDGLEAPSISTQAITEANSEGNAPSPATAVVDSGITKKTPAKKRTAGQAAFGAHITPKKSTRNKMANVIVSK
jgi:hypothetical protein